MHSFEIKDCEKIENCHFIVLMTSDKIKKNDLRNHQTMNFSLCFF